MHIVKSFISGTMEDPNQVVCRRLAIPMHAHEKFKDLIDDPGREDVQTDLLTSHLLHEEGAFYRDEKGVAGLTIMQFDNPAHRRAWEEGGALDPQDRPRIVSETFFERGTPVITVMRDSVNRFAKAVFHANDKGHAHDFRSNFVEHHYREDAQDMTLATGRVRAKIVDMPVPTRTPTLALTG